MIGLKTKISGVREEKKGERGNKSLKMVMDRSYLITAEWYSIYSKNPYPEILKVKIWDKELAVTVGSHWIESTVKRSSRHFVPEGETGHKWSRLLRNMLRSRGASPITNCYLLILKSWKRKRVCWLLEIWLSKFDK